MQSVYSVHFVHSVRSAKRIATIGVIGLRILRYGLVLLLLMWGGAKFTPAEATGIQTLVVHSPFLSWMYPLFGVQGTSSVFGVIEIAVAIVIAARHWFPRASGYASLASSGMFLMTLSFLVTTPDVFAPSSPWGGFLMKDLILLGVALFTGSEALGAAHAATNHEERDIRRAMAA
jgi:uncharacterized membrane protein YkgB